MDRMIRCRGWLITLVTFFHFFANYGFLYSYGQFFIIFQEEFGKGATVTGWLGTVPFGLTYLASPLSNALIARFQHRLVAAIGVILCFISLIVTSFMTSLLPMFFTFSLLYGFGINFVTVAGLNIILQYFPDKNSARAVTIALIGCNAGLLAVNPLVYFLIDYLGWRNTLRIASAAVMATGVAAVSLFTMPRQHLKRKAAKDEMKYLEASLGGMGEKNGPCAGELNGNDLKQTEEQNTVCENTKMIHNNVEQNTELTCENPRMMKDIQRDEPRALKVLWYPELWMLASALVVCSAAVCFFYMSLVNFMVSKQFTKETSAMMMTALGLSQVVGKVMVALVGDHLPFPKIFTLVIANLIGAVQMGCLLVASSLIATISIISISGLFVISVLDTIPHALSHQLFHRSQCLVSWTVVTSAMGSGYVVGALLGESIDQTGSYDCALYVCMAFFLSSALLCTFVPLYQSTCASKRRVTMVTSTEEKEVNQEKCETSN